MHPITPARVLWLCVGWTGAGASTKAMVDSVAQLAARKPELVSRAMDGIRALVQNAELCIEGGDLPALGKLMNMNQMILAGLMVSTEGIETLCAEARGAGALGAKLTGAGGGGSVIALLAGRRGALGREAWNPRLHGILDLHRQRRAPPCEERGAVIGLSARGVAHRHRAREVLGQRLFCHNLPAGPEPLVELLACAPPPRALRLRARAAR